MSLRRSLALAIALGLVAAPAFADPPPDRKAPSTDPLLAAYQKEYAFLEAEKHALSRRLDEVKRDAEARKQRARAEIAALEQRLVQASVDADRQDARLADQERVAESEGAAADALASVLTQARSLGVETEALDGAFSGAVALLAERSSVRRERGSFFDEKGQRVEGDVLKIGEIAAFGASPSSAGPQAPAGAGELKVWQAADGERARALLAGARPASLQLFLFEGLDKGVDPPKDKSPLEIVQAGGTIAWVIVGLGLVALLLAALRLLALLRAGAGAERLLEQVTTSVRLGGFSEAISLLERSRGAMARVLLATVRHRELEREARADRIDEQLLRSFSLIDRFGSLILVMAAVAPLLGLLGTVTGMIATFDAITEFGTGDPRVLAGGISEALITTELGLLVAIPALLVGNLLSGLGDQLKRRIETAALSVANLCDEGEEAEEIDLLLRKAS